MFLMSQLSQQQPLVDNRIRPDFQLDLGLKSPPATREIRRGWAIEPSPTGWPYPFWIWNLPHDFWLGGFTAIEAGRAVEVLGDADRYPDHASAAAAIDSAWGFVTKGRRARGVA
jgi:hypothetical protein